MYTCTSLKCSILILQSYYASYNAVIYGSVCHIKCIMHIINASEYKTKKVLLLIQA